jgi:hypothetical protein
MSQNLGVGILSAFNVGQWEITLKCVLVCNTHRVQIFSICNNNGYPPQL